MIKPILKGDYMMADEKLSKCPFCNATLSRNYQYCYNCGADLKGTVLLDSEETDPEFDGKIKLEGIAGWLQFLCVMMTMLIPASVIYEVFGTLQNLESYSNRYLNFQSSFTIEIIVKLVVVIFSIYAGTRLWQKRPGAVVLSMGFFAFTILSNLILYVVRFELSVYNDLNELVRTIIVASLWILYLLKSVRVRNTFYARTKEDILKSES